MTHEASRPSPNEDRANPARLGFELPPPARVSAARLTAFAVMGAAALGGLFVAGWLPRARQHRAAADAAELAAHRLPRVDVVTPERVNGNRTYTLPGSVQALEETTLYARANGYVRRWLVDIGDHVTEGQDLAELDTPELDQELAQAKAQLAQAEATILQAKANRDFSRANLERYKKLTSDGLASQQDLDQRAAQASIDEASVAVALANVGAQQANIRRLAELKSFARVKAPFSGTVTVRSIERGSLVTSNATPLFKVAALDPMRIFVQVPQDVAPSVHVDMPANVRLHEFGERVFEGKIARTAGALDPASRTMMTEVRVANPKGELLPGMYAEVTLTLATPHQAWEIPATALLNDGHGLRVAVVGENDTIRLVPIVLERDTGATIQVSAGLRGGERVVRLANAALSDGMKVDVAPAPAHSAN